MCGCMGAIRAALCLERPPPPLVRPPSTDVSSERRRGSRAPNYQMTRSRKEISLVKWSRRTHSCSGETLSHSASPLVISTKSSIFLLSGLVHLKSQPVLLRQPPEFGLIHLPDILLLSRGKMQLLLLTKSQKTSSQMPHVDEKRWVGVHNGFWPWLLRCNRASRSISGAPASPSAQGGAIWPV